MENREVYILGIALICFLLMGWSVIHFNLTFNKHLRESEIEQKKIFNKCVDLVIEGKDSEAKELYNKELLDRNGRKSFLNGLFIGLDTEKNKDRLLEHKYKIDP